MPFLRDVHQPHEPWRPGIQPVVHVFVNGSVILSRVPDWISNRGKGTNAKEDHAAFRNAVVLAVQEAIIVEDRDQ